MISRSVQKDNLFFLKVLSSQEGLGRMEERFPPKILVGAVGMGLGRAALAVSVG